jgi:hypothetical protein
MVVMETSVKGGVLDLYAPKFELNELGHPGENIFLRVVVESVDKKRLTLFASYVIGRRHIQIDTKKLAELGATLNVISVDRYSEDDFLGDVNDCISRQDSQGNLNLSRKNEGLLLSIDGNSVPARLDSPYTAAARIYAVIHCGQSEVRIAMGEKVELFDLQRRKLVGLRLADGEPVLLRSFQHREKD